MPSTFNLRDWDKRIPIAADITKPWGEYHVFQDFSVTSQNPLPKNILNAIHKRFAELLIDQPELKSDQQVATLANINNNLIDQASADEKILVVLPKQPGYEILSMQYHGHEGLSGHIEVWEFLTSSAVILGSNSFKPYGWKESEIGSEMNSLKVMHFEKGDYLVILPGQWHALAKPKNIDFVVVREWRITPEAGRSWGDREDNIVRTYDNAGRGKLGKFPEELTSQL